MFKFAEFHAGNLFKTKTRALRMRALGGERYFFPAFQTKWCLIEIQLIGYNSFKKNFIIKIRTRGVSYGITRYH